MKKNIHTYRISDDEKFLALISSNEISIIDVATKDILRNYKLNLIDPHILFLDAHTAFILDDNKLMCIDYLNSNIKWTYKDVKEYNVALSSSRCAIVRDSCIHFINTQNGKEDLRSYSVASSNFIHLTDFDSSGNLLSYSDKLGNHIIDVTTSNEIFSFTDTYFPIFADSLVITLQRNGNEVNSYLIKNQRKHSQFQIELGTKAINAAGRKVNVRGYNSGMLLCVTTSRANSAISVWDVNSGKCHSKLNADVSKFTGYYLSNDFNLWTIDKYGHLSHWNLGMDHVFDKPIHHRRINDIAVSNNRNYILSVGNDSMAVLSDSNCKIIRKFKLDSDGDCTTWNESTNRFIVGTASGSIYAVSPLFKNIMKWSTTHLLNITMLKSMDNGYTISSGMDNRLCLWDETGKKVEEVIISDDDNKHVCCFDNTNNHDILSANWNNRTITITDFFNKKQRYDLLFPFDVEYVSYLSDNSFAVLSGETLSIWNFKNGRFQNITEKDCVKQVISKPKDNSVLYVSDENEVILSDIRLNEVRKFNCGKENIVYASCNASGTLIVLCTIYGDTYKSWILNALTLDPIISYTFSIPALFGKFDSDNSIYYTFLNGTIRKYDIPSYETTIRKAINAAGLLP